MKTLLRRMRRWFGGGERPGQVDIIVPVFNAYNETRACLERLTRYTDPGHGVIVIDDASSDPRVAALLGGFKRNRPSSLILRNSANLGFTATVNRGMSLSANDVVLLNSDAMVTPGWLDRLTECAASDPAIGTITPFSNNATICSFPEFCRINPVPPDPDAVARIFREVIQPAYPELPTAVGFCMYIRRRLLNEIGLFNLAVFGKGYGEENDFCLRAAAAGYRNVLCDNAYVAHVGHSSFGKAKEHLAARNMEKLLSLHPEYATLVHDYIERDPLADIRARVLDALQAEGIQLVNDSSHPTAHIGP